MHAGIETEAALGPVALDLPPPIVGEATDHVMLFGDHDLGAGVGEQGRRRQTAVSGADDGDIVSAVAGRPDDRGCRPIKGLLPPKPSLQHHADQQLRPDDRRKTAHENCGDGWPEAEHQNFSEGEEQEDGAPYGRDDPVDRHELDGLGDIGVFAPRVFGGPGFAKRRAAETKEAEADERGRHGIVSEPRPPDEVREAEQGEKCQGGDLQRFHGVRPQPPTAGRRGKRKTQSDGESWLAGSRQDPEDNQRQKAHSGRDRCPHVIAPYRTDQALRTTTSTLGLASRSALTQINPRLLQRQALHVREDFR